MNSILLKSTIAGLLLTISGLANAGIITTLFSSNNSGGDGGAVYFDVTVGNNDLSVTGFETNFDTPSSFTDFEVWLLSSVTSQGNESSSSWLQVATGSGVGAGLDNITSINLSNTFSLNANTLYGFALISSASNGHHYTNGNGSNQSYSNADLTLSMGSASNTAFSSTVFNPRVWNGSINYTVGNVSVPEPSSLAILALGIIGLASRKYRKLPCTLGKFNEKKSTYQGAFYL